MHSRIETYFTNRLGSQLLYSAEDWVRVTLRLETAGPVAVSTAQEIAPVLSGKGRLLPVGDEITFILPKGDRLFIVAASSNRVSWQIEPVPWLQQILMAMDQGFGATIKALFRLKNPKAAPRKPNAAEISPVSCPPGTKDWRASPVAPAASPSTTPSTQLKDDPGLRRLWDRR